ncbi:MAG: DUF6933 domain-containing protein [Vicinamibacterales bacterium]
MPRNTPSLLCAQRLWRLVRGWDARSLGCESAVDEASLGPWAATVFRENERDLVLVIDVRTYLTVAFRLGGSLSEFRDAFAVALGVALDDLGVPRSRIGLEVKAVGRLPLGRLQDATVREALDTVDFMCGIELSNHSDLRTVQRNLNRFPHPHPPDYVPEAAVRRLFGVSERVNLPRNVQ